MYYAWYVKDALILIVSDLKFFVMTAEKDMKTSTKIISFFRINNGLLQLKSVKIKFHQFLKN